ncbi:phospholipase D-like domain-containing protein [Peredibacter sp. HCB2-198]|uniref:phospholipase D-like domain-containing protein n=1 Tax=Peredibacter sp. HCB2-198 TaxID=3383025 RepID=UPI0038B4BE8F
MNVSDYIIANTHKNINHLEKITELIKCSHQVRIICPFISMERAKWLATFVTEERSVEVITEVTLRGIATGVQLPSVLNFMIEKGIKVSYIEGNLHAKVFIFDGSRILISSANLTNNGLENNFEVGVLFEKPRGPFLAKNIDYQAIYYRISNLWSDLKIKAHFLNEESIQPLLAKEDETAEFRRALSVYSNQKHNGFNPISKDCENPSQVDNELQGGWLFKGFRQEDWKAFDHGLEFNTQNLEKVKQLLTDKINPVLMRFYENFRFAHNLEVKLDYFDYGFSLNRWVKNYFPDYRYLWLTRSQEEKSSLQHIGVPSFIVGMGKDPQKGHWFEARMGVEELNLSKLSFYGRQFLENMIENIDVVVQKLKDLGPGWVLTHEPTGKEFCGEYPAHSIEQDFLMKLFQDHLISGKIADFHIRRKYFLSSPEELKIVQSPKIIEAIARDMNSLIYFFELAHGNVDSTFRKAG